MLELTHAAGYEHPCQFTMNDIDLSMGDSNATHSMQDCFGYEKTPVEIQW